MKSGSYFRLDLFSFFKTVHSIYNLKISNLPTGHGHYAVQKSMYNKMCILLTFFMK